MRGEYRGRKKRRNRVIKCERPTKNIHLLIIHNYNHSPCVKSDFLNYFSHFMFKTKQKKKTLNTKWGFAESSMFLSGKRVAKWGESKCKEIHKLQISIFN